MIEDIISDVEDRMKKSITALQKDFAAIRTGRANPAMFDGIRVSVYGTEMPLNQVATISCPEPRLVVIQPWDRGNLGEVEKAILKSDLSQSLQRREPHPHPDTGPHRGAAQGVREACQAEGRGVPGGRPECPPRRQRHDQGAGKRQGHIRGRIKKRAGEDPEDHR